MEKYKVVYEFLDKAGIVYDVVEHPPALTTEEADRYIEGKKGVRTKTLFLCNKKATNFYLLAMDEHKRVDMKKLGELLDEKGMRFCSSERLQEKMDLLPGMVSLFGLLDNKERDIKVCFDKEMLQEEIVTFYANDCTKTLFISTADMCKFVKEIGYEYRLLEL